MSKLHLLNLLLFVVVISLASLIYFSEVPDTRLQLLTDISPDDIRSIKIQHNKNTTTINKLNETQWQVTQPVSIAANNFRISSILKLLQAPVHKRYDLTEIDPGKIGLENPSTSIQFDDTSIAFGLINTATNLRYIRSENSIYTIEDVYYPLLSSNFSSLVSLNLLPVNSTIEKLILLDQTIAKDEKGLWRSNREIDTDSIIKTIDYWQHRQAFGIHKYLPRNELSEVFIHIKNQAEPIRYIVTDTDPWLILARPELELEYHLDIEAYEQLFKPGIDTQTD